MTSTFQYLINSPDTTINNQCNPLYFQYNSNTKAENSNDFKVTKFKQQARNAVTEQVKISSLLDDHGQVGFQTLFDNNFTHEQQVLAQCPNATIISVNSEKSKVQYWLDNEFKFSEKSQGKRLILQNMLNPKWYLINDNILKTKGDFINENNKPLNVVRWFDFCSLVNCYEDFFTTVENLTSVAHNTIFCTFSFMPRGRNTSSFFKKVIDFKPTDSIEKGVKKLCKDAVKRMNALGFEPIYNLVYETSRGGRMITLGFRQPWTQEQLSKINYYSLVENENFKRSAGITDIESSELIAKYTSKESIRGLRRSGTVRKAKIN